MRLIRILLTIIVTSAALYASPASALAFPDRARAGVVDAAHVLSDSQRATLNEKVVAWDRSTGHQLVVATVPDLQGADIKDYGYQLGRAWALGDKQRNDGVILLLAMAEHKVRIEVGYGLEPVLTDALTSEILSDRVVPRLREGDVPMALNDGAEAIMTAATPAPAEIGKPISAHPARHGAPLWGAILAIGALFAGMGGWVWFWIVRDRRQRRETERLEREIAERRARIDAHRLDVARIISEPLRSPPARRFSTTTPGYGARPDPSPICASTPSYTPSPSYSPPSSSDSGSSFGSSDSSSSSASFDSGGGSFGGGGADSSW